MNKSELEGGGIEHDDLDTQARAQHRFDRYGIGGIRGGTHTKKVGGLCLTGVQRRYQHHGMFFFPFHRIASFSIMCFFCSFFIKFNIPKVAFLWRIGVAHTGVEGAFSNNLEIEKITYYSSVVVCLQ